MTLRSLFPSKIRKNTQEIFRESINLVMNANLKESSKDKYVSKFIEIHKEMEAINQKLIKQFENIDNTLINAGELWHERNIFND